MACDKEVSYTNDQQIGDGARRFIYADDHLQGKPLLRRPLCELTTSPRANPEKTQVAALHLQNKKAKRSILCNPGHYFSISIFIVIL